MKAMDRRRRDRIRRGGRALIGAKRSRRERCENAFIEEWTGKGARVLSGAPVNPEDSLVLYVGEERKTVRAKVVWSKRGGLIEKRTGRPGQGYVAGLRLRTVRKPKAVKVGHGKHLSRAVHFGVVAGAAAVAGLFAYFVISLFSML